MKLLRLTFLVCTCMISHMQSTAQQWPGIKDSLYSKAIGETRKIQVILPKDYKPGSGSKYEVLYMPDGEWYMEQIPFIYNFVASANFAPQNIFVLIPNTYVNGVNIRARDYSPTKTPEDSLTGGADNYHAFLKNELIPYIEGKYPANGERTLVGSSYSGLFAIYAFFKEPNLFQSFVASDPNLVYDNFFVPKLAAEKVSGFTNVNSTLFFAGLETSSKYMGSQRLDSVMKAKAPKALHWKYIEYKGETHYSVQHKAFYDGMRYSHQGYTKDPLRFHPMNGIVEKGKAISLFMPNEPTPARYTLDGSDPTPSSPVFQNGSVSVSGPCSVSMLTFPNRRKDAQRFLAIFRAGSIEPEKSSAKTKPLTFALYDGQYDKLPDFTKLKATTTGKIEKGFSLSNIKGKGDAAYLIDGSLDVDQDGYYIFATTAGDGARIKLSGQTLIELDRSSGGDVRSFAVPLKKGRYPLRLELLRRSKSPEIVFSIYRTTPQNANWWENVFVMME